MKRIAFLFLFFYSLCSVSQNISLVNIDRLGGGFTKKVDISPMNLIFSFVNSYDINDMDQTFLFAGDSSGFGIPNPPFLNIDLQNDSVKNTFRLNNGIRSIGAANVRSLKFNDSTGSLYAIIQDSLVPSDKFLASVNTNNGLFSRIDTLPSNFGFDQFTNDFIHIDSNWYVSASPYDKKLYCFDLNTAQLVHSPNYLQLSDSNDVLFRLEYYQKTGTIYGLYYDDSQNDYSLVTLNPVNGNYSSIGRLNNVSNVFSRTFEVNYTLDSKNDLYLFQGQDSNGVYRLFSVDLNTANIVSSPLYPIYKNQDSIYMPEQILTNNTNGTYYGITVGMQQLSTDILENKVKDASLKIYPNPAHESITIELPELNEELLIQLFNQRGQLVRSFQETNKEQLIMQRFDIPNGVYFINISVGEDSWTERIIFN